MTPAEDELLTEAEMCAKAKITPSQLRDLSRGPNPVIPAFRLGRKTKRYHFATVVRHLSIREGIIFDPNEFRVQRMAPPKNEN